MLTAGSRMTRSALCLWKRPLCLLWSVCRSSSRRRVAFAPRTVQWPRLGVGFHRRALAMCFIPRLTNSRQCSLSATAVASEAWASYHATHSGACFSRGRSCGQRLESDERDYAPAPGEWHLRPLRSCANRCVRAPPDAHAPTAPRWNAALLRPREQHPVRTDHSQCQGSASSTANAPTCLDDSAMLVHAGSAV
jgi:hypothetical protein